MLEAPIPAHEKERLRAVQSLALLDTEPEARFDRITKAATAIFGVDISALVFIDERREWFKSVSGTTVQEYDRLLSFCGHVIATDDLLIIPDTHADLRFVDHPLVTGGPMIRFYAGVPIKSIDGHRVGVLCLKDKKPRQLNEKERQTLLSLAAWAELEVNTKTISSVLNSLQRALDQQTLVAQIAELLVEQRDFSHVVQSAIEQVGQYIGVSRVYIFEDANDGVTTSNTYEWCNTGVEPQKDQLQNFPYSYVPSYKELFQKNKMIFSEDIINLPKDLYDILAPQQILSIIVLPIIVDGRQIGFVGFDECTRKIHWQQSEIDLLKTIAGMLSNFYQKERFHQSLVREQIRLDYTIRGTNVGTWEWNIQTGEVLFNERWAEIIGYTLKELAPISIETWIHACHPDDLKKSDERLKEHFVGTTDFYTCEARMRHKDGHWVWVLDRGKVFEWTPDGKPLRMYGTHLDISDQKQREQLLTEKSQELSKLNQFMISRERRMAELKDRIQDLQSLV